MLLFFAATLAFGCAQQKAAPEILSVTPNRLPQQLESQLAVGGQNFFTEVRGALEPGVPTIDRSFDIRVADQKVLEVLSSTPQSVNVRVQANLPAGLQPISLTTPGGRYAELANAVTIEPVELRLETAPGGAGEPVVDRNIQLGMSVMIFSVVRFADDVFFRDETVSWSIQGNSGMFSNAMGTSTVFTPTDVGAVKLIASHPILGQATVLFTVRRCTGDADCVDECHSMGSCASGECMQGPVDKDLDQDGFIDIVCEGGNDCDDNPDACGANCFPGNEAPDGCDGFDQECDGEVDEDPDVTWYEDKDGDGFGKTSTSQVTCTPPIGYAPDGSDCDDEPEKCGASCSPGVDESLAAGNCADTLDNDCDSDIDDLDRSCIAPNTPPLLNIEVEPGAGTTGTTFAGSATATDREDPPEALVFEWDWDGDGTFEASGTASTHSFSATGRYSVTVRVRDNGGLQSWAQVEVVVTGDPNLIKVTTEIDESDAGASPGTPGGTGLSLREAIAYSNAQAGTQTIWVPSAIETSVSSPIVADGDAFELFADGARLRCIGAVDGLRIESDNNEVFGLRVDGCQIGIRVDGSNNRIVRVRATNNSSAGVQLQGSNNTVGPDGYMEGNGIGVQALMPSTIFRNQISNNNNEGIQVGIQGDGSQVWGNTLFANRSGIVLSGAQDAVVRFNTVSTSTDHGVQLSGGSRRIILQCNILTANGRHGLQAFTSDFALRQYNDFFANGNGACTACSPDATSFQLDPEFVDTSVDDYRLSPFSALIDRCPDLGLNVNGPEPGDFNGDAPDLGGWESPYQ